MNKTLTLLLAIVAMVLLVTVFFFRNTVPGTTESKLLGSYVVQFAIEDVQTFSITRGDEKLTFTKEGEGWKLQNKITDAASASAVTDILSLAQNLRVLDVIQANEFGPNLRQANFGLSKPKQHLSIKLPQQVIELSFGEEGPTEKSVFVGTSISKHIFLVSDQLLDAITKPIDTFRDRRLAAISSEHIEKISIHRPSFELELQRKSTDQWEITSPLHTPADAAKVETLLETFLGSAIFKFLPPTAPSTNPSSNEAINEIKVWPEGQDIPLVFRLGTPATDEEQNIVLPVYSSARQDSFLIPAENTELADSTITSLRSYYFFPLNPDTIDTIRIKRNGQSILLQRTTSDQEQKEPQTSADKWVRKMPNGAETPVAQSVTPLLEKLSQIQATKFLPFNPDSSESALLDTNANRSAIELEFNSLLSENTPEAPAGIQRIATVACHNAQDQLVARVDNSSEICLLPPEALTILNELVQRSEEANSESAE